MRSSTVTLASMALAASQLVSAQTYTDCNPLDKTCPADPALGTTIVVDFTSEASVTEHFNLSSGTTLTYDSTNGAAFVINEVGQAPTITSQKYIMFGKVDVVMRASPGTGIVSSVVLQSDDLDEIDWEFLGSVDSTVETNFFGKGNTTTYDREVTVAAASNQDDFNTYTVDWTADRILWQVNGVTLRTVNYGDALTLYGKNYPQTPMTVKMGNWIACASAAAATASATEGTCEWVGGYVDISNAPFTQYVKSVTIQDYGCATSYYYSDTTGDYTSIVSEGSCSNSSSSSSSSSSKSSSTGTGGVFATVSGASATGSSNLTATTTKSSTSTSKTGTSTTSSTTAKSSTNSAPSKPKHVNGPIEYGVMALGLVLGYLVM